MCFSWAGPMDDLPKGLTQQPLPLLPGGNAVAQPQHHHPAGPSRGSAGARGAPSEPGLGRACSGGLSPQRPRQRLPSHRLLPAPSTADPIPASPPAQTHQEPPWEIALQVRRRGCSRDRGRIQAGVFLRVGSFRSAIFHPYRKRMHELPPSWKGHHKPKPPS